MDLTKLRPKHLHDCDWSEKEIVLAVRILERQLRLMQRKKRARLRSIQQYRNRPHRHPFYHEDRVVGWTEYGKPIIQL